MFPQRQTRVSFRGGGAFSGRVLRPRNTEMLENPWYEVPESERLKGSGLFFARDKGRRSKRKTKMESLSNMLPEGVKIL